MCLEIRKMESGTNTGFMTDYDGIPFLGVRLNEHSRCKII